MQEDKTPKRLGSMLRKQQEENPLPYELGAWEAFSKKRAAGTGKKTAYWISGIAAALALLLVAGGLWLSKNLETIPANPSGPIALEESTSKPTIEGSKSIMPENKEEKNTQDTDESAQLAEVKSEIKTENQSVTPSQSTKSEQPKVNRSQTAFIDPKAEPKEVIPSKSQPSKEQKNLAPEATKTEKLSNPDLMQSLAATKETMDPDKGKLTSEALEETVVLKEELPKEPQLTSEEIEEILDTPSFARLALGLYPGFGASQNSSQITSGSSLGLGVMVDMDIAGKLVMGSGLAVNYLNQASESQSYAQVAGFSSPVTQTQEIAQVQVDIPVFFKYPITRNQSISVQAGFSNLLTFNQSAEQESSYTRQIAVLDALSANSSAFTLRSESVNQSQVLNVPNQRFFPLATANFGVNFRLFESKKTSYEIMPFYNYPLQEFSGYGEKLGMVGASFKVNFRNIKQK
ncbi:porin family protein [Algoriphagus litoralis]|uniref:hypothetical protein n=1 Tax=Algoriphagus litoralis TaxID=2202829 RepID=UPI000DBAB44B|nr:hypothetical protein [Algoriphagus litoralis]